MRYAWLFILFAAGALTACQDAREVEKASDGRLTLVGASAQTFNATGDLELQIQGGRLTPDVSKLVVLNGTLPLPASAVQLDGDRIRVLGILQDGTNDVKVIAADHEEGQLGFSGKLVAGENALTVSVTDGAGALVDGAVVTAALGDNLGVFATAVTAGGQAHFEHLPSMTIVLTARAASNLFGTTAVPGEAVAASVALRGFDAPSAVHNNDFSLGLDGWNLGGAPVRLVAHEEGPMTPSAPPLLSPVRERSPELSLRMLPLAPTASTTSSLTSNLDLELTTLGEGPQSLSRTFVTEPGVTHVTVRYRFVTAEVPGGFFGSRYDDYFSVCLRSQSGGSALDESNSMNALGMGAFDEAGATTWREASLPVNDEGDIVQIDLTVANVADGLFDSQLVVDLVAQNNLGITQLALNDVDNSPLQFLSADEHPYFSGHTRLHGTLAVAGKKGDSLQSVELELLQGGVLVAHAPLAASAQGMLLRPFGTGGSVQVASPQLLFELPALDATAVKSITEGTVSLRVRARSANGEEATKDFSPATVLVRYKGANRYGDRDEALGGDDWVRPTVRPVLEHFGEVTFGDLSNMNGGAFLPHTTHLEGLEADGWFEGYDARDAATAQRLLGYLNDPAFGSRIRSVFVSFDSARQARFWDAIRETVLADGRQASNVIRNVAGHETHFHWVISPE